MASVTLLQYEVVMFAHLCLVKDRRHSLAAENGLSPNTSHPVIGFLKMRREHGGGLKQLISVLGVFKENV